MSDHLPDAIDKTKEAATRATHVVADKAPDVADSAKKTAKAALDRQRRKGNNTAEPAKGKLKEMAGTATGKSRSHAQTAGNPGPAVLVALRPQCLGTQQHRRIHESRSTPDHNVIAPGRPAPVWERRQEESRPATSPK